MELKNKTVLIIAQEDWGDMFISKHHYAYELAKLNNTVFFINGPDQVNKLKPGEVRIVDTNIPNLFLVEHRFFYPYMIKFKANWLHQLLVQVHIHNILKRIGKKVDIVWSFDLSNTIPLRFFPKEVFKIFMPVDEPLTEAAIESAKGTDILFSVTNEILEKYSSYAVPKYFINHGVSEKFMNNEISDKTNEPIRVGLSGNMLRPDIDHDTLATIIKSNKGVRFSIWGTTNPSSSNLVSLRDANKKSLEFVNWLSTISNVTLHGQVKSEQLACELRNVDAFLICYDIKKDQSKGTNYHKVLEYLATGKVIISNNITTYKEYPDLIKMTTSRKDNNDLPQLFSEVLKDIASNNSMELQKRRIQFAEDFIYYKQVEKIGKLIDTAYKTRKKLFAA